RPKRQRTSGLDDAVDGSTCRLARVFQTSPGARVSDGRRSDGALHADQWRVDGGPAGRRRAIRTLAEVRVDGGHYSVARGIGRNCRGGLVENLRQQETTPRTRNAQSSQSLVGFSLKSSLRSPRILRSLRLAFCLTG